MANKYGGAVLAVLVAVAIGACGGDEEEGTEERPVALWPPEERVIEGPTEVVRSFYVDLLDQRRQILGEKFVNGQLEIFRRQENGTLGPSVGRALLEERGDGWVLTRIESPGVILREPQAEDTVPAGSLTVAGRGRGFEGNLLIRALSLEGDELDQKIATAGALAALRPFRVELDLSDAEPGSTVAILVYNTSAVDGSIAELAAVPIRISD